MTKIVTQFTPYCFDTDEQYRNWQKMAKRYTGSYVLKKSEHCLDCTPEYKKRMIQAGRCQHPQVVFVLKKTEGELEMLGMRQLAKRCEMPKVVEPAAL